MVIDINSDFLLRPFLESDAFAVAKYANNKKIADFLRDGFPYPYLLNDAHQFIKIATADTPTKYFAMEYCKEVIGSIGVFPGSDIYRIGAEMGYWIGEPFWGKGLTSLAVKALLPYSFEVFQLARIHAKPMSVNTASQKVLLKSGFTLEAVLKNAIIKNNIIYDEYIFSIFK